MKEKYEINKIHLSVVIIKRFIHVGNTNKSPIIEMTTILTRAGYILKHSWGKTIKEELMIKKTMHIAKNGRVFYNKRLYLKNNWDQDTRLKAIYLDKVVRITTHYIYIIHRSSTQWYQIETYFERLETQK